MAFGTGAPFRRRCGRTISNSKTREPSFAIFPTTRRKRDDLSPGGRGGQDSSLSLRALASTRAGEYVTTGSMNYIPRRLVRSLQDAYSILIKGFGKTGSSTAPGPGATIAGMKPASFAQKLWRAFLRPRGGGGAP